MKIVKILLVLVALGAIGGLVAYKMWNKQHVSIQKADGKKVSATDLYTAFTKDSTNALKNFASKDEVLEVSGEVKGISKNQEQKSIVTLKSGGDGDINCTFEGTIGNLKIGDQTTVKGLCTGIGQGDAEMGLAGDVYLTRCYLKKG